MKKIDWRSLGVSLVAGTDEVGRGCLAGPVYAAAVILRPDIRIKKLTDSKLLGPELRIEIAEIIKRQALCWSISQSSVEEIETHNILQASLLAMRRAVEGLSVIPELVVIDGNQKIGGPWPQVTYIKGDLRCQPISAASILAKVERDCLMGELDQKYPGYGFSEHKGYATLVHRKAICDLGPSAIHRKKFSGVKEFLDDYSL